MNFFDEVEKVKIKQRILNLEEIKNSVEEDWVKEKIKNYAERFDGIFTEEEIKKAILENRIVASIFCKDPSKQNISEQMACEILGVKKLPASGKNCIRFNDDGDIVSVANGNTKSADFIYNEYYATQKYTVVDGGAQDNQRNDVIDFLKRGSLKNKVMAVLDGPYWDKYRPTLQKQFENNPNVIITSVTEITESKGEKK